MSKKKVLTNDLQLTPQLLGTSTMMVSMAGGVSASRGQMEGSQSSQLLVLNNPTYPRTYTCVEQEMAKYTIAARASEHCDVVRLINLHQNQLNRDVVDHNPSSVIIVKDGMHRNTYDIIEVPNHYRNHNNFGYMSVPTPKLRRIRSAIDRALRKGDVLCDSPGVTPEGFYCNGILANVAFLGVAYVTEDGYWASDEFCEEAASTGIGEIVINIPKNSLLIPIYGTDGRLQFIPDRGQKVNPDGMLAALRERDFILDAYNLRTDSCSEIDVTFDEPKYVEGRCRDATVIDIEVVLNKKEFKEKQIVGFNDEGEPLRNQIMELWEERVRYSKEILNTYNEIERHHRGEKINYSPALKKEIVRAMYIVDSDSGGSTVPRYHGQDIPYAIISIRYKYKIVPERGAKLAGVFGDKGVICHKTPRSHMPTDIHGNVCDLVAHPNATINRMIPCRLDDNYLGAQCLLKEKQIRELWEDGEYGEAYDVIAEFTSVATPRAYNEKFLPYYEDPNITESERRKRQYECVKGVVDNHIMLELKQNDVPNYIALTAALEERWPYPKGRLAFMRSNGRPGLTKSKGIIGTNYIRVLEKTGTDYGAVDSPVRQGHGIAAKLSYRDRNSRPNRRQPYRLGESEIRPLVALAGEAFVSHILDMSNNPTVSAVVQRNIMESEYPSAIYEIVDRNKYPVGNSVTLQYLHNSLFNAGIMFVRDDADRGSEE